MSPIHRRLHTVVGDRSCRAIADLTGFNPETTRRYLSGGAPSVEFVAALCAATGVNAQWLLTGEGCVYAEQVRFDILQSAAPSDLFAALAKRMDEIAARLTQLQQSVGALESQRRQAGDVGVMNGFPDDGGRTVGPTQAEFTNGAGHAAAED